MADEREAEVILRLEAVSGGYGNGMALEEVSLTVAVHGVTCVLGRNGAGKTSLARAILGLLHLEAGRIYFDGADITRASTYDRSRAGITWVAQEDGLFPGLTVREHLDLVRRRFPGHDDAECVLDSFPILVERGPVDAGRLSGGERKMLQLAMALLTRPRLLVLDEPTEGVAPRVVEHLREVIGDLGRSTSVLLIEQNLGTAMALGDGGYVLEAGRVVAELSRDAVRSPHALREWVEL